MKDIENDQNIEQDPLDSSERSEIIYGLSASIEYTVKFLKDVLNLQKGVNKRATIVEIRDKNSLAGANAWMLMCSIVIASIGLSQNSQAVIIGAMLISPLMSPILGIGLSVGINDMDTLRKSLANFCLAIAIAIITSTLYFYIIDFGEITDEILSRTRPTLLDIFVAIFGGIAGIISIARKDLSTTLPGVAIATALMPPLCVTGYGIASGDADIAAKSFYLFFLNTFFVALATYLIIRLLKFPFKKYVKRAERLRNTAVILLFTAIVVIPSIFIFKNVIRDTKEKTIIKQFLTTCLTTEQQYLLDDYKLIKEEKTQTSTLYLKCYGDEINSNRSTEYQNCLAQLGLKNVNIQIISSSEVNLGQVELIEKNIDEITAKLSVVNEEKKRQEKILNQYQAATVDSATIIELYKEVALLYPEIEALGLSKMKYYNEEGKMTLIPTAVLKWKTASKSEKSEAEIKLNAFIKERLDMDTLRTISQ